MNGAMREVGRVKALFRYPVKSMAGEALASAALGWHGLEGDRRFALFRTGDQSGFPWLTAVRLPSLVRYTPVNRSGAGGADAPTHVLTPDGREVPLLGPLLDEEVS